jgi:hypothetical protein
MGSRSTQETKIPAYIEEAGKKALERAQQIQDLGYVPYMGPEIAEISETERALNRNVGAMASAFGLEGPAPLTMGDAEVTSAGGVSGYSSYPAYMSALQRLQEQRPEQYSYLAGLGRFDPITGAAIAPPPVPEVATGPLGMTPASGGGNDDSLSHAEIMEMHYGIKPAGNVSGLMDTKGQIGKYSGSMQGMSPIDKIKSDLGYAKATVKKDVGKLFGGLFGG